MVFYSAVGKPKPFRDVQTTQKRREKANLGTPRTTRLGREKILGREKLTEYNDIIYIYAHTGEYIPHIRYSYHIY